MACKLQAFVLMGTCGDLVATCFAHVCNWHIAACHTVAEFAFQTLHGGSIHDHLASLSDY